MTHQFMISNFIPCVSESLLVIRMAASSASLELQECRDRKAAIRSSAPTVSLRTSHFSQFVVCGRKVVGAKVEPRWAKGRREKTFEVVIGTRKLKQNILKF